MGGGCVWGGGFTSAEAGVWAETDFASVETGAWVETGVWVEADFSSVETGCRGR